MAEAPAEAAAAPLPGARRVVTAAEVAGAWDRLAAGLQPRVAAGDVVLLGILLGALPTLAALAARLRGDFLVETCRVSRYRGGLTGGDLEWQCRPALDLRGRTVVVVDDICDAGTTLAAVARWCREAGARAVVTAVLVQRVSPSGTPGGAADLAGLTRGPGYLFGAGMDVDGRFRHLPDLYQLAAVP
jgi:hypoxanthine phosphoribosyltransferase